MRLRHPWLILMGSALLLGCRATPKPAPVVGGDLPGDGPAFTERNAAGDSAMQRTPRAPELADAAKTKHDTAVPLPPRPNTASDNQPVASTVTPLVQPAPAGTSDGTQAETEPLPALNRETPRRSTDLAPPHSSSSEPRTIVTEDQQPLRQKASLPTPHQQRSDHPTSINSVSFPPGTPHPSPGQQSPSPLSLTAPTASRPASQRLSTTPLPRPPATTPPASAAAAGIPLPASTVTPLAGITRQSSPTVNLSGTTNASPHANRPTIGLWDSVAPRQPVTGSQSSATAKLTGHTALARPAPQPPGQTALLPAPSNQRFDPVANMPDSVLLQEWLSDPAAEAEWRNAEAARLATDQKARAEEQDRLRRALYRVLLQSDPPPKP